MTKISFRRKPFCRWSFPTGLRAAKPRWRGSDESRPRRESCWLRRRNWKATPVVFFSSSPRCNCYAFIFDPFVFSVTGLLYYQTKCSGLTKYIFAMPNYCDIEQLHRNKIVGEEGWTQRRCFGENLPTGTITRQANRVYKTLLKKD